MLRRLLPLLLGFTLCGLVHAGSQPQIELAATAAWKGWARPGRATELNIRLTADASTRATVDVVASGQSVRADVDLLPGRTVRLHIPVTSTEKVTVRAVVGDGLAVQRDITIAPSESPLLGVGLATDDRVQLDGFHTLVLAADDLPRNALAYSGVDALILDAPTLGSLDQRQLAALLAHAAGCGRIVVVNTDPAVQRVLDGAGGCGGRALMAAGSLPTAKDMLKSSLAESLPPAMSRGGIGGLAPADQVIWNRVAVGLAVYFAVAAMAVMLCSFWPVLLLVPALAAVVALALLHAMHAPSQLVVWSEGESGAPLARFQAWQQFPGLVRERTRVPIPSQLAHAAQACDLRQPMRLDYDVKLGHATFAEFETQLFGQVSLCYAGSFPIARSLAIDARPDGSRDVLNAGTQAWPRGVLLDAGLVHELPALDPGARTTVNMRLEQRVHEAVVRTAMTRTRLDGVAALWELELVGAVDASIDSKGWLLVSMPAP